jgi:hypothetical protein
VGRIYGGEITDYAVFPTWNHWPVGQMPSDGRYASFPDRTGHSSLTQLGLPTYREDFGDKPFEERLLMEGVSNKSPIELLPLAKSWLNPAPIKGKKGCENAYYDSGQRAYVIYADGPRVVLKLKGSKESPIVNPAFVISNWNFKNTGVKVNGEKVKENHLRIGYPRTVIDKDVVIWIQFESERDTVFKKLWERRAIYIYEFNEIKMIKDGLEVDIPSKSLILITIK